MRIGLISDTHGVLRPEVFDRLAGVDRILHAGDVGPAALLDDLRAIAPVEAVWGNTDGFELRAGLAAELETECDGVRIGLAHGHRVERFEHLTAAFPAADVIVHGHSHVPRHERADGVLWINPGSAGPGSPGWPPTVAVAHVEADRLTVVHVEVLSGAVLRWPGRHD